MTNLDLDRLEALCSPTTPEEIQALFTGAASALPALLSAACERDRLRQRITELVRTLADAEITIETCGGVARLEVYDDGDTPLARVRCYEQSIDRPLRYGRAYDEGHAAGVAAERRYVRDLARVTHRDGFVDQVLKRVQD